MDLLARRVGERLVDQVVPGDDRVPGVTPGELFPQRDKAVLELQVFPEQGLVGRVIAVPVGVLPALDGVQVEDGIQLVLLAPAKDLVEAAKPGLEVLEGLQVALEMPVVERQADDICPAALYECNVLFREKIIEPAVKKEGRPGRPKDFRHRCPQLSFGAGESVDEALHVHPPPNADAAQPDGTSMWIDDDPVFNLQHFHDRSSPKRIVTL